MSVQLMPTYFLSHGGGPWPWMKEEMPYYELLEKSLKAIPDQLPQTPQAILMVSGHWETKDFCVMTNANPPLLYDYYGFPEQTYRIQYPAPGSPILAAKVKALLEQNGFVVTEDNQRGYDHGSFVPLYSMYPEANIPVVQLSIREDYDPEVHINVGRALSALRSDGILILGSGLSFHNLRAMLGNPMQAQQPSGHFDRWLNHTLLELGPKERIQQLLQWSQAPSARFAHPREDHLIPLMVACGAAETELASVCYKDMFLNQIAVSGFRFGSPDIL